MLPSLITFNDSNLMESLSSLFIDAAEPSTAALQLALQSIPPLIYLSLVLN